MKYFLGFILLIWIQMVHASELKARQEVDLIIKHATIYTLDDQEKIASSVAVKSGRILAIGTDTEIEDLYWSRNILDATGSYVYPGFIDAHSHFSGFAEFLMYADLNLANSFEEMISIIREFHENNPTEWIVGRGWDQNKWAVKEFPDNTLLNALFPVTPVVLSRVDGHAVLANQAAIIAAGIKPPYRSGEVVCKDGNPTGIFLEVTADQIKASIPDPDHTVMSKLLVKASLLCHAKGLTGVNDAGIDKDMILLLDSLHRSGVLKMRIDAMINPVQDNLDYFMTDTMFRTDWLRVGSVKFYADGALGSRGACLLEPYNDDPTNTGILTIDMQAFEAVCERAKQTAFQVNTHAIGDSAIRIVLKTYEKYLHGKNDLRWRIEHAQVVNEEDFDLFGKLSVIPSIQATHATSDMGWAENRLGKSRVRNAYAYKRLLEQNGWIPNGTDFPIEDISPLRTFYASVARKDMKGNPAEGFLKENALSRMEALKSITIWAARAAFEEENRGSLEKGKLADMVILDKDLIITPENEILKTQVLFTIVGGEIVFDNRNTNN
jgi:predicted amidohydrolase YtcJ